MKIYNDFNIKCWKKSPQQSLNSCLVLQFRNLHPHHFTNGDCGVKGSSHRQVINASLRQWCWVEFHPASIKSGHGKWLVMTKLVTSLRVVFHGHKQPLPLYFSRRDMKSLCAPESEPYFMSGCWVEIDRRYWVEIISTQHQATIPSIENSLPLQKLWFRFTPIYGFSSMSRYTKTSQSHSPINSRVKFD